MSCKPYNHIIIQAQEKQEEVNVVILQSLRNRNNRGHFGSVMERRTEVIGNMLLGLLVGTGQIEMTNYR